MPTALSDNLRLAALDRCGILDTPPDPQFDRIARLAAQLFGTSMAAISFVTRDRSWFKSTYGLQQSQVARPASFCSHTIGCPEVLVIPDATSDLRFADLALVAGPPRVRFYAGVPVVTADGFAVGALAVMDARSRRQPSESEICALQGFSALISRELKGTSSAGAAWHNAVLPVAGHGGGAWSILSAVVQSAEDAIVSTDLSGVILSWNPGAERLCGYSAAEMLGRPIFLTIPPERLEEAREMITKAAQGQPNVRRETVLIHKDGTRRFVSLSISAIKDADGKPGGIAGIAHDITALSLTEATRREAEDRLRLAQEAAGVGIWDWSVPSSGATSEQCFRTYGLPAGETTMSYAQWLSTVHPGDRDRVQAYHESLLQGTGRGDAEFRIIWPDGSVRWIVSRAKMYPNTAGVAARVIGINLDVTHLREAEQARRESEERYASLSQATSQAVICLDGEGVFLAANPAAENLFGHTIDEMRGRHRSDLWWKATREDGTPITLNELPCMVTLRTGSEFHDVVLRIWNARTQEPHWVSTDVIPWVRAGETKPYQVYVICRDITAQVEAAARLRASEERCRLLIEHGMEVIGVIDAAATVTYVSPSVERVFGYPPDVLIGTHAMDYVRPDDRPAVQGALAGILHSPPSTAVTLHIRLRHRDGSWCSVESAAANCLHVEGLRGIVVNAQDISKRVQYQEQLRQLAARVESAREEERARISREVHDELGQMLSVLKLDLETLASQHRPRSAKARGEFDKRVAAMVRGIDLSMNTVRRIAAEMRPAIFEDLGLAAALNWQLQEFESRTGIRCHRRGLRQDAGLAAEPALAVFRIFQEILTNVVRHAHATILKVEIDTDRDWFTLRVCDNGKGFDPRLLSPSHSLGLLGVRERAGMHGGTVEWSGRRNGGTMVMVRLPRGVSGALGRNPVLTSPSDL